jgi:short-subunit dehydrogenase
MHSHPFVSIFMPPASDTVLVTGASSGIGRELAHCFAADGFECVLLARSEDVLSDVADALGTAYGTDAHVLPADLSVPGAADTVAEQLQERGLTVDVLVNNAGVGARGAFADLDPQRQVDMIQVNVTALTHLTRRLLPSMQERGRGGVLNVASTAGFQSGPYMSVYYATKAYVLSFSDGLAEEMAGTGVTVTCLAPGPTRTAFADRADMDDARLMDLGATMTPGAVAAAGYDAFRAGRTLEIPGWPNKVGAVLTRVTPRALARKVTAWLNGGAAGAR